MEIGSFHISLLLAQSVAMAVLAGTLIVELFKKERKNKSDVIVFLGLVALWLIFLTIGALSVFAGGLNEILGLISFISFIVMFLVFGILIIKRFEFFNKPLLFSEITLLLIILITILTIADDYAVIVIPIVIMTFISTFLGYFIVITFLINSSEGPMPKKIKKKKSRFFWVVFGGVIAMVIVLSVGFIGGIFYQGTYVPPRLSGELNIYNWKNYFDENAALIDDFEKEFGVEVNLYTFTTEEELLDAVENYGGVYDLIVSLDASFEKLIADDKLEMLNKKNIPNIKNIDEKFEVAHNQNFDYGAPYLWGTTGLAINTKYISEDMDSWDILWNPEYAGKVGILFNEIELFSLGARYVGTPLVPSRIDDLIRIGDFLKLQKELVGGYMNSYDIIDEMINESLWVSVTWNVDAGMMADENPNIKYIIPKEGTMLWIEHMVIPKGAQNKVNAEAFINFIHRPENYARIANYQWSPGVNVPAREFIDEEIMSDETLNIPGDEFYKLEDYYKFSPSQEILNARHKIWEELIV